MYNKPIIKVTNPDHGQMYYTVRGDEDKLSPNDTELCKRCIFNDKDCNLLKRANEFIKSNNMVITVSACGGFMKKPEDNEKIIFPGLD